MMKEQHFCDKKEIAGDGFLSSHDLISLPLFPSLVYNKAG